MDNANNRGVLPFCPFPDIVFINEEAKGCISEEARDAIITSRNLYSCVFISCFTVSVATSSQCKFVVKSWKDLLFPYLPMQKLFGDKNHWFQLFSTKNSRNISLFLISITLHIFQLSHHVCCWEINKLLPLMKTLLLLFTKSPNVRKLCFSICSLSFLCFLVFAFWPIEATTESLRALTHSNSSKSANQVTPSNKFLLTKRRTRVFYRLPILVFVVWHSRE